MLSTFSSFCLAMIALGIWAGLIFFVITLIQLRRAARAVEMLAYNLDDSVGQIREASLRLNDFAQKVRSGWMRALEVAVGAATTLWPAARRSESERSSTNDS